MDPNDLPVFPAQPDATEPEPATTPATTPGTSPARSSGFRRTVLTAGMAAALLIAGGVAAVSAASPDPSTSPTPAATANPSDDGSTSSGSTAPDGSRADCPDKSGQDGTAAIPSPTPTP
jgi:hypothetical protein